MSISPAGKGTGGQICESAIHESREKIEALFPDVKVFTLDTPTWNTRTNAFYTRLGYSEAKRDSDFVYYTKKR